jgi:hypothetical protein
MANLNATSRTSSTTQSSVSRTVVLAADVVDAKPAPGTLDVGEVVKLTNDNGKVEYYVGTADGGISKPLSSVSSAVSQVTTQVNRAEKIQTAALNSSNKIEISELRDSLEDQGLSTTDINKIIKEEKAINATESTQLKSLLAEPGLQYGVRDAATNTFVNNAVNGVTTQTTPPTSLLTYNDPVYSGPATQAIQKANDAVTEFQLLHGMTQQFEGKGDNQVGIDPYNIYQALDGNHIETIRDPVTNKVIDYKFSDAVAKSGGDQSGLMNAIGGDDFGKYEARALVQILSTNSLLGQPVAVSTDAKGNLFVNATTLDANGRPIAQKDANGNPIDRYATQNALVDTGEKIQVGTNKETGEPIYGQVFAELATDNSKRNKVSVVSTYIKQPDGTFTFGGVTDMAYTHIDKMGVGDIAKAVAIGAASIAAGYYAGPLLNLSGTAATLAGGAVAGATGAALTGRNVLTGALTGAVLAYGADAVQQAAQAAGGYSNLGNQILNRDFSAFSGATTNAGIKLGLDAAGNVIDATTGLPFGGQGVALNAGTVLNANTGINLLNGAGSVIGSQILGQAAGGGTLGNLISTSGGAGGTTAGDILGANMGGVGDIANQVNLNPITNVPGGSAGINLSVNANGQIVDNATGLPFSGPGIKLGLDAAGNIIDATTGLPFTGPGINVINPTTGTYVNTTGGNTTTTSGGNTSGGGGNGGLLGNDTLTNTLAIGGGVLAVNKLKDALTPKAPAEETYTAPLLVAGKAPMTQVPNFAQNYNNLFNRQGVGAGQFLGYDYLKNINVPPELMGLLGTSAQARPTSLTMPTPTSITPA